MCLSQIKSEYIGDAARPGLEGEEYALRSEPLQRARKAPAQVGAQAMRGLTAEVIDWNGIEGHVFTQGERWQARGTEAFRPGEMVEGPALRI